MKAERRIISKRCMLQYIPGDIFRASFRFFMGDKLRDKIEGVKGMKRFSVNEVVQNLSNHMDRQAHTCDRSREMAGRSQTPP